MRSSLYREVHDAARDLFDSATADPLGVFGFADLLASADPAERSAAFAVAEAQGRSAAATDVISRIVTAGHTGPAPLAVGLDLGLPTSKPGSIVALAGCPDPFPADLLIAEVSSAGRWQGRPAREASPVASELDPGYLRAFAFTDGVDAPTDLGAADPVSSLARTRLACAAEILGCCERMLADAVSYCSVRRQFGAPLATFQAVAHTLAWATTEVRQLRALLDVSLAADPLRTVDARLAAVTKALAGTVGHRVAQLTLQVTGGMAFTWEYPHNAFHRRVLALDAVAGSADAIEVELGRAAREAGAFPALFELAGQG